MFKFRFGYAAWTKQKIQMVQTEWPARTESFLHQFAHDVTGYALDEVVERIPSSKEYDAYRESLRLARVRGTPYPVFAITAAQREATPISPAEVPKTIIYVRPKRHLSGKAVPEEIRVLARYGPWTVDTLPFVPDKKKAQLIVRRVHPKEVDRVAKSRRSDRILWAKALAALGIKGKRRTVKSELSKRNVLTDSAYQALRLEFGLGAQQPKAHWRPGIKSLRTVGLRRLARKKAFAHAFLRVGYKAWTKWPQPRSMPIRAREAAKLRHFQKRLGIRVR